MLLARLPPKCAPAEHLKLHAPLDPNSWTVSFGDLGEHSLFASLDLLALHFGLPLENVFVQFRMDDLGRHEYVSLGEVKLRSPQSAEGSCGTLRVLSEDYVKELRRRLGDQSLLVLTAARPELLPDAPVLSAGPVSDEDLCPPRGIYRNYSLCEDLALGPLQRVMLSDESTLGHGVEKNGIKIFNHLKLIINCHESASADKPGKYRVGTARPTVIFQPIHELMCAKQATVIAVMDRIQQEVWRCLQEGSVAVHCLAGVHRAPTVVVCHYLYRYYVLGHTDVCHDVTTIYSRLRAVRPGVEPLSYIRLIDKYQDYLVSKYGRAPSAAAPMAAVGR